MLSFFTLLAYLYKGWHTGFASTFLYYILLTLILYESLLYFTSFLKMEVMREISSKRLQAGGKQFVTIKMKRKLPFPLIWYAAHERWPENMPFVPSQIVFPWFKKEIDITLEIPQLARGVYELKEITIVCGDLFGLMKLDKTIDRLDQFIVYPRYDLLGTWSVKDGQHSGHASIARRHSDELTSVVGVREYAYGDRLSQIHWKATAKNHTLKTKEYEYHVSNHFAVFLDTRPSAYPDNAAFEKAIRLVASLIYLGKKRQLKYSLLLEGALGRARMLEGAQEHDFFRVLEELARLRLDGEGSVASLVGQTLPQLPRGTHLVIVTSQVDRSLSVLLTDLAQKRTTVELFLASESSADDQRMWIHKLQGSGVILHRELA
ncbi:DUF58 domain-containing protein [Ammoniphilus sp. CFH 90114]|nr:DUF58 domain-containing protein [Ammoniphilus sp. CFH 90114]